MRVTVDERELSVVKRLIRERLEALSDEIHRTESREFKHALERRRTTAW